MKRITKSEDGKYQVVSCGMAAGVLGSYTGVVTGDPLTRTQQIILAGSTFAAGVLTSALVFARSKEKYAWFDKLSTSRDEPTL